MKRLKFKYCFVVFIVQGFGDAVCASLQIENIGNAFHATCNSALIHKMNVTNINIFFKYYRNQIHLGQIEETHFAAHIVSQICGETDHVWQVYRVIINQLNIWTLMNWIQILHIKGIKTIIKKNVITKLIWSNWIWLGLNVDYSTALPVPRLFFS